jgi:hypothetical protein
MILVEVREAVVEEDGGSKVFGQLKLHDTFRDILLLRAEGVLGGLTRRLPPHGVGVGVLGLEGCRDIWDLRLQVRGDDVFDFGGVGFAARVVDLDLLDLFRFRGALVFS